MRAWRRTRLLIMTEALEKGAKSYAALKRLPGYSTIYQVADDAYLLDCVGVVERPKTDLDKPLEKGTVMLVRKVSEKDLEELFPSKNHRSDGWDQIGAELEAVEAME